MVRSFDNWAEDIKLRWEYSMEYYQKRAKVKKLNFMNLSNMNFIGSGIN